MKLGVVGKGGVGKTTVSALVADAYRRRGRKVIAIDTDSNPNLGLSLGLSLDSVESVPVLPRALIVGVGGDTTAEELISEYGRATPAGVTLLSAIRVTEAGAGCMCGGHATVRSLLAEAIDAHAEVTVVDMEAGLEHLSRSGGTLAYADTLLVVMEPSRKSVITAARTRSLASELGITRVLGVGNKARSQEDVEFLREASAEQDVELAGVLPYANSVVEADQRGEPVVDSKDPSVREAIDRIVAHVEGATVA